MSETKQEPGCECLARKHLSWMLGTYEGKHKAMCSTLVKSTIYTNEPPPPSYHPTTAPFPVLGCNCGLFYLRRLISDPCPCEQLRGEMAVRNKEVASSLASAGGVVQGLLAERDSLRIELDGAKHIAALAKKHWEEWKLEEIHLRAELATAQAGFRDAAKIEASKTLEVKP